MTDVVRGVLGVLVAVAVALAFGAPWAAVSAGGAAAVAGAIGLMRGPRGRIPLILAISFTMGAATLVGSLAARHTVVFVCLVVLWSFGAGMMWAVGPRAGLIAAAGSVLLVGAAAVPLSIATTLGAAALAVAGGLVQALLVAVWPGRRWRVQREAMAGAYRAVAAHAHALADNPHAVFDPAPLIMMREAFILTDRQAARRPPAFRSLYGLPERIRPSLTALAHAADSGTPAESAAARAWLHTTGDVLGHIASRRPDELKYARHLLQNLVASTDLASSFGGATQPLALQLARALDLASSDSMLKGEKAQRLERPGLAARLHSVADAVTGQLSPSSPVLRHALRLACATGTAAALALATGMQHGYWIALTTLMVMRPQTAHTVERCLARVTGNAAGVLLPAAVTLIWHPGTVVNAVLAMLFIGCAYLVAETGYVALSASLAAAIIFLTSATGASESDAVATRLAATAIGGLLAVAAHFLLPDTANAQLRQRADEAITAHRMYLAAALTLFTNPGQESTAAVRSAGRRALRARSELASFAHRKDLGATAQSRAAEVRETLDPLHTACAVLETHQPSGTATPPLPEAQELATALLERLQPRGVLAPGTDPGESRAGWEESAARLTAHPDRSRYQALLSQAAAAAVAMDRLQAIEERW
ncbi:FUSC family protein [Streptomyces sp. IBSNAI002]|uniref:FUSC family protein n=1 Tax=Streptomyces sp. IBSNAI002 TaxID=3457500 RepID=UPI003FD17D4C